MSELTQDVSALKGVGEALSGKLGRLGVASIADLLFHLPLRYQDRTRVTPIGTLRAGHEAVVQNRQMLGLVQNIVDLGQHSSVGRSQSLQAYSSAVNANVQMASQSGQHPSQAEHSIEYAGSRILQEVAG